MARSAVPRTSAIARAVAHMPKSSAAGIDRRGRPSASAPAAVTSAARSADVAATRESASCTSAGHFSDTIQMRPGSSAANA
eukprot:6019726-Pleurochrysis_carterae.AAC.2